MLDRAGRDGASTVHLRTESAAGFFEHPGFAKVDRAMAPVEILQARRAAGLCPASADLFAKTIQG
jgi:N-acetylglutamate synthase-like GNAT family acetyltransferase